MRICGLPSLGLFAAFSIASIGYVQAVAQNVGKTEEELRFDGARAQTEPKERVLQLEQYLQTFPSGSRRSPAQELLLNTLLSNFPDQINKIHQVAADQVRNAPPGVERWIEESRLANQLANAGIAGIDLDDAAVWARDAVDSLTELSYKREAAAAQLRYKLPKNSPRQIQGEYVQYRASFLAALANVDLRRKRLDEAAVLLDEAFRSQPLSGEVNALRGQLALAQGAASAALQAFERADALGGLAPQWHEQELHLFQTLEHGSAHALDSRVDELYRTLYPPLFTLPHRELPPGGHTALLELFTGSGCLPCAGPDLAVDSLLGSYRRQDLAVLEFDEHIPRPDPLANPYSVAVAARYCLGGTPAAFLDGSPLDILGASRQDVENIVVSFADTIEDEAVLPSGLRLDLAVTNDDPSTIHTRPTIAVTPLTAAINTGEISFRKLSKAIMYVALVQDNVRYSGENGVRLHRMVVRSLFHADATAYLATKTTAPPITFHLADIEKGQEAYLADFQRNNDRFGTFHFATTDIPLRDGRFAVVAWVQDPATRRILQTAYTDVPAR